MSSLIFYLMSVERGEQGNVFHLPEEKYWVSFLKARLEHETSTLAFMSKGSRPHSATEYEVSILGELLKNGEVNTWETSMLFNTDARFSHSNFNEACSTVETFITNFDFLKLKILEREKKQEK